MMHSTVEDIRNYFKDALALEEFVIDKTGVKTIELINASFIADEESIFGEPNHDYIRREIDWYLSKSLNVNDIPGKVPEIWKQVADNKGNINSNYGWCIFSPENGFMSYHNIFALEAFKDINSDCQYNRVRDELIANPNSRRAVMIYTRPEMWLDYNRNGRSDFMCTNTVQYLIRDNQLHSIVQMRSNDVVFGYRNDYAWQKFVLDSLAAELHMHPGNIYWNVGSLHVYERHFGMVV